MQPVTPNPDPPGEGEHRQPLLIDSLEKGSEFGMDGVSDFHMKDENLSLSRRRTRKFAPELLRRGRRYTYCFPSGIKMNCNFVLGLPVESRADSSLTCSCIRKIAASGLDQVVTFMLTPIPETGVADLKLDDIE